MPYYNIHVTDEQIKRAEEWKALADKYNLTLEELREIAYHADKIKGLLK